jgi:PAS domain-containing protein
MQPTEPLPLHHSWPLFEAGLRLVQGLVHDGSGPARQLPLAPTFHCDLSTDLLTWAPPVFALFGVAAGAEPSREVTLGMYDDHSRSAVERLRAHAIRHRRGFTIDAEIRPLDQARRWIRITAMPAIENGRVTAIEGWKHDVTAEYR